MKDLSSFIKKAELMKIVLDSEDIIEEFGESVIFYMNDYVDINTYFEFYRSQSDGLELNSILRKIILNEKGDPVLGNDDVLPVRLAVGALTKINENLGKLKTKPLMSETGNLQS